MLPIGCGMCISFVRSVCGKFSGIDLKFNNMRLTVSSGTSGVARRDIRILPTGGFGTIKSVIRRNRTTAGSVDSGI